MIRSEHRPASVRGQAVSLLACAALVATAVAVRGAEPVPPLPNPGFSPRSAPFIRPASGLAPAAPAGIAPADPLGLGGRPPWVGANLEISDPQLPFPDGLTGRSETALAASRGGRVLVVGWNDLEGFCGPPWNVSCPAPPTPGFTGYAVSSDGGRTFDDRGAPFVGTRIGFGPGGGALSASGRYVTGGDPSLDSGGPGGRRFYFANRSYFEDSRLTTGGVSVHMGTVSGRGDLVFDDAALLQSPDFPFDELDKPHVAADHRFWSDLVTVSLTNFKQVDGVARSGLGQIEAFTSLDGGATWGRAIIQPDETLTPFDQGVINQGSEPVVAPDGTLYVAWQRGYLSPFFLQGALGVWPQVRVARSDDGGASWQPAAPYPAGTIDNPAGTLVSATCAGDLFPPSGSNRIQSNSWPRISVAPSGRHRGRLYVVWQDCRIANGGPMPAPLGAEDLMGVDFGHPDTDILLSYSDDRAATWSEPVVVAGGGDGLLQFWPTVSVGPSGVVDVTYSESFEPDGTSFKGQDGGTSLVDVYWVRSTDGGQSFGPPVRVTEQTSDWGAAATFLVPNFGDYNDALTLGQSLFVTWADGRTGVPAVDFARAKGSHGR